MVAKRKDSDAMKSANSQPLGSPARCRWLLAAVIVLEAAWIVLLAVLAVLR